jgi:hypothetical protein
MLIAGLLAPTRGVISMDGPPGYLWRCSRRQDRSLSYGLTVQTVHYVQSEDPEPSLCLGDLAPREVPDD